VGAAKSTVSYELALLQRMFNLARRNEKLDTVPTFPELRVNNAREEYITDGELAGLMVELPEYLRGLAAFRYYTGWRDAETLRLRWDQVDWKSGEIFIERGAASKNYEPRRFPFHNYPELRAVLEAQRDYTRQWERQSTHDIELVFHREGKDIKSFRRAWVGACRRVGAIGRNGRPKRPHDLCRSAARRMEQAGIPRSIAKALFGRRTESIFTRYAVVDAARDLAAGTERLAALGNRHTIGTLKGADHKDGVLAETRTPYAATDCVE
jgi:integrase